MFYFLVAGLLVGCTSITKPDLTRLYAFRDVSKTIPTPVVVIHGAFGSRLVNESGAELWPGTLRRILWSDYRGIELEIDPDSLEPLPDELVVSGITERIAGKDYYGQIRNMLETVGGYEFTQPGLPVDPERRRYYLFEYDWRQDNVQSARKLHRLLDQIRLDYGDSELRFDVVAHSMGGLITRYFARYGSVDVLDGNEFPVSGVGSGYLRRVALIGTPNLGSITSLMNQISGMKVGFGTIPPEVLATFPSGYQLLPHPLAEWVYTSTGKSLERDLFDVGIWKDLNFSVFSEEAETAVRARYSSPAEGAAAVATLHKFVYKHLERGRRFVWSLTVPGDEVTVDYIVFGGDCHPTPNRLLIEEVDGISVVRLLPENIKNKVPGMDYERLMLEPGDGTVSKASLLARQTTDPTIERHRYSYFPLKYPIFLCEKHTQLTGNISFQDNLMHVLLSRDED